MRKAGCQPPWRRFDVEGLPVCDNWTLLDKYSEENLKISDTMTKGELIKTTMCLMPCTFMEYRVSQFMK